jgi:hypothetical protein
MQSQKAVHAMPFRLLELKQKQNKECVILKRYSAKTHRRNFLCRLPARTNSTLIPPERVSPAEINGGRSAREIPSFSMISIAACQGALFASQIKISRGNYVELQI